MTTQIRPTFVKCHKCGWVHFTQTPEEAKAQVAEANEYLASIHDPHRTSYEVYLRCFRCGEDSAGFLPAQEEDGPLGATIQPTVVVR